MLQPQWNVDIERRRQARAAHKARDSRHAGARQEGEK